MDWWLVDGLGMRVSIGNAADLVRRIADASAKNPDAPTLTLQKGSESFMHIGVDKEVGYLNYVEGPAERSYVSVGNPAAEGTAWFSYAGSGSEIPLKNCLPMGHLLEAVAEYYQTGSMPSSVQWEPD